MTVDNIVKVLLCILAVLLAFAFANIYAVQYIKLNDWGVWANWAAAIANILMAFSAVYAAINAKNWIKDKHNSAGYEHVTKLMADYDISFLEMHRFYFIMLDLVRTNEIFNSVKTRMNNNVYKIMSLQDRLKSCSRFSISQQIGFDNHLEEMVNFYDLCLELYIVLSGVEIADCNNAKEKLSTQYRDIKNFRAKLDKDIIELFNFN
ncbi:hypothetical protein AI2618V1_1896 [Serratia marcescens]|nr:hypothetical protein AI2618V1_1896 [Serratia marcescens]CAE7299336.1 hypothetical protein AI2617V1_1889 [Serratia marcescens]CAH3648447.1 hypothetical protein AI2618V1_1896 [Serratia marcescens]CAH3945411.1 hypothetical protein AI2617V1_1889 [Serratia marcescens]